jgi:hypothetical protein
VTIRTVGRASLPTRRSRETRSWWAANRAPSRASTTSVTTRTPEAACPGTEVGWISRSESAQRASANQGDQQRRPSWSVAVRASTSSQESPGVSAFHDGTSSVAANGISTCGETQADHS